MRSRPAAASGLHLRARHARAIAARARPVRRSAAPARTRPAHGPENLAAIRALAEIHDRVGDYSDASDNAVRDDRQPATPPSGRRLPPFGAGSVAPRTRGSGSGRTGAGGSASGANSGCHAAVVAPPAHASPAPPTAPARVPHPDEAALPRSRLFSRPSAPRRHRAGSRSTSAGRARSTRPRIAHASTPCATPSPVSASMP